MWGGRGLVSRAVEHACSAQRAVRIQRHTCTLEDMSRSSASAARLRQSSPAICGRVGQSRGSVRNTQLSTTVRSGSSSRNSRSATRPSDSSMRCSSLWRVSRTGGRDRLSSAVSLRVDRAPGPPRRRMSTTHSVVQAIMLPVVALGVRGGTCTVSPLRGTAYGSMGRRVRNRRFRWCHGWATALRTVPDSPAAPPRGYLEGSLRWLTAERSRLH